MYYKTDEIKNKTINFNGFESKMSAMKRHDGISIQVKDMNNVPLKSFHVMDLSELYIITDVTYDVINEWIEENTDEQDRLINLIMKWWEAAMKQTVTYIIRRKDMSIYITNKPTNNNSDISYSTNRNRARGFNGMEEASINMDYHKAIKRTATETIECEEVEHD